MTVAEAAALLAEAARHKVTKAGPEITLLIDVSRTMAFALLAVVEEYRRRHGGATYGFLTCGPPVRQRSSSTGSVVRSDEP